MNKSKPIRVIEKVKKFSIEKENYIFKDAKLERERIKLSLVDGKLVKLVKMKSLMQLLLVHFNLAVPVS